MKRKFRNRSLCILYPDVLESDAYLSLSGRSAMVVFIRFYQKIHRKRIKGRKGIKEVAITNNGQIIFPYSEAEELRVSRRTFNRVIHELIEDKGLIDIGEPGNWYDKLPTKFAISERWKHFGTNRYQAVKLERILPKGLGFQPGNYKGRVRK